MSRVGTWIFEILPNHGLELLERAGLDVELPFEAGAHLAFHLVNLPKGKHFLANNTPGFVGVSIIADVLGSNRECRDEKAVAGGTTSGDKPCLERSESHGGRESHAMESIGDEVGKGRGVDG